ncbi:hypothetical protein GGS21DRAFT_539405 [Xylaria nigripes]|nr:hypothetical protein GGS21DRAFT_539405 [Xylaria nigripes]
MAIPSRQKQWAITGTGKDFETLQYIEGDVPKIEDHDVLIRMHAASLNYRDVIIPKGLYPFPLQPPVVAGSDGAGEVVQVGSKVSKWKKGDRVVTLFNQGHQSGPLTYAALETSLGGRIDGTLRRYAVYNETGLVRAPSNLSYVEAATLTCAGLTSWNALYGLKPIQAGGTVLVQGTGGVSVFALQFAKASGATVIATTSSKTKEELFKKMGADHVINYKEDPNWGETVKKLTGGEGVDIVIEVGGADTAEQSLKAIKIEGTIVVIGFLGGAEVKASIMECLGHACIVRGVIVGSRQQMEEMVAAVEKHDIHPIIDPKVFTFEQTKEAYEYMWSQQHVGKVAIKIE